MLALQISSMKKFMNQLLAGDAFDIFLLEEASVSTANTYTIDGRINRDFYTAEELEAGICPYEFQPWSETKGLCFHLIKGKHTPLFFKFVLHLKPEKTQELLTGAVSAADGSTAAGINATGNTSAAGIALPDTPAANSTPDFSQVKALVLTIRYDGSRAVLTTGTAYHTFVLSKDADVLWDKAFTAYLAAQDIDFQLL